MNFRAQLEQSIILLICSLKGTPYLEKRLCASTDIRQETLKKYHILKREASFIKK